MVTDTIPRVDVGLPEISHVAFVVEDLEAAMDRFGRLLGVEPWFLYRYEPPRLTDTTYRGEPAEYSMRVAVTDVKGPIDLSTRVVSGGTLRRVIDWITSLRDRLRVGPSREESGEKLSSLPSPGVPGMNLELIEPLEGSSTYTEFHGGGDGIHHIGCFAYDDPRAVVETYEDAGIQVVQSGRFEGLEFWYLDMTEELNGLLLEIAANLWAVPTPDRTYPE